MGKKRETVDGYDVVPATLVRSGDRVRMTLQDPVCDVREARTTTANGRPAIYAKVEDAGGAVLDFFVSPDHSVLRIPRGT